jgi:hypothetical protein
MVEVVVVEVVVVGDRKRGNSFLRAHKRNNTSIAYTTHNDYALRTHSSLHYIARTAPRQSNAYRAILSTKHSQVVSERLYLLYLALLQLDRVQQMEPAVRKRWWEIATFARLLCVPAGQRHELVIGFHEHSAKECQSNENTCDLCPLPYCGREGHQTTTANANTPSGQLRG